MMLPPPARRSLGTAYLHIRNAPVRLTPMAWFHCASDSVSTVPSGVIAAATLTRVVSLPKAATVALHRLFRARLVGDIDRKAAGAAAASTIARAVASALAGSRSATATAAPFSRKPPRNRAADLAAAAGDQRHPPFQPAAPSVRGRCLNEAAVEDRRLRRITASS